MLSSSFFYICSFLYAYESAAPRPLNPNWKKEEEEEEEVLFLSLSLSSIKKKDLSLSGRIFIYRARVSACACVCVCVCIRGDVTNKDVWCICFLFQKPPHKQKTQTTTQRTRKQKVIETPNTAFFKLN
jgi:hypothetical protein